MRYLIIGAGGTGGFMAANMAEAGLDVAVIARGEHLQRIRAQGLGLETPERGEYTVWVKPAQWKNIWAQTEETAARRYLTARPRM